MNTENIHQIILRDYDPSSVTIMSQNSHQHQKEEQNPTTRLPSPFRQSVSKYCLPETNIYIFVQLVVY